MLLRTDAVSNVRRLLREAPVVALLGPRQVGKTTLARYIGSTWRGPVTHFDLEDPRDLATLADPTLTLAACRGLVVLDEIQRRPDLFPALRVLADRQPVRCRFLVLGSASPHLLRQSAETLAGRIAFHELRPFALAELGAPELLKRWRRGGFPRAFLARSEPDSVRWRQDFVQTFLERDLPQLGVSTSSATMRRLWEMLAHLHGGVLNSSEIARNFGVADTTIRRYLETLESTFVVRMLRPYHANLGKRQVKAPKVYVADSGILHTLLDVQSAAQLERHPKIGASWEGFMLETVVAVTKARAEQCYFWATHAGAELDLLITSGGSRRGFEFKRTSSPTLTPSMRTAMVDLELDRLDVIHAGDRSFALAPNIRAIAAVDLLREI